MRRIERQASQWRRTARRLLAMPATDAYDPPGPLPEDPVDLPIYPGPWYHGTDHRLRPGTVLRPPEGGQSPFGATRQNWTWVSDNPWHASAYGQYVYQVEPLDEGPWPWNGDTEGRKYVSPRAQILRRVPTAEWRQIAQDNTYNPATQFYAREAARIAMPNPGRPPLPYNYSWTPPVDDDGLVTLYHRTTPEFADSIIADQRFRPGKKWAPGHEDEWEKFDDDEIWFVTDPNGKPGYARGGKSFTDAYGPAVVKVKLPPEKVYFVGQGLESKPGDVMHALVYPEDLAGVPIERHASQLQKPFGLSGN